MQSTMHTLSSPLLFLLQHLGDLDQQPVGAEPALDVSGTAVGRVSAVDLDSQRAPVNAAGNDGLGLLLRRGFLASVDGGGNVLKEDGRVDGVVNVLYGDLDSVLLMDCPLGAVVGVAFFGLCHGEAPTGAYLSAVGTQVLGGGGDTCRVDTLRLAVAGRVAKELGGLTVTGPHLEDAGLAVGGKSSEDDELGKHVVGLEGTDGKKYGELGSNGNRTWLLV